MQPRAGFHTIVPLHYLLPLIILIEGFSSIAIEILTIRQLLPVAGGSVIVTSLIIGVFLLFLALGYEKGGRIEKNLHGILRRNFFMVAVWCGIGVSYTFISWFFSFIQKFSGPHIVYPLIAYLLLVLAPAIYLLGQTLPITMNIVKQDRTAGAIAGKAMGLSTVGSFLGAVFTTLVLMHFLGVAWTVFIIFLSLIVLSLLMSQTRGSFILMLSLSIVTGVLIYLINISIERNMFLLTNNHANYQILNHTNSNLQEGQKILVINEVLSSYTNEKNDAFAYIELMRKWIFDDLLLRGQDILVLGAGGFTLSAGDVGENHFTYVDIDSNIQKVVEPNFIPVIKDTLVIDDARNFLNTTKKKYKVIVVDVFSDYKAIPAHLLTHEFMMSVKNHLKDDGYAMFNIIADATFSDPYSKRIDNTIRSAFGSCIAAPTVYKSGATNIIYSCTKNARPNDTVVYVDDLNNSTTDSFTW